jgi:hypothetical protein
MEDKKYMCMVLVGKPKGYRQLGRPRHRFEDNIKRCLTEIGWSCMDWIHLAQDGASGGLLLTRLRNFKFHKILGNF